MKTNPVFEKGQSLVELLVTIGLTTIILPAILTGFVSGREGRPQEKQRLEAVTLLQEGQEAVRSIREKGWSTFAVNGIYHPVISGSSWGLVAGAETINDFTRTVQITDVYRDADGRIVFSGGILDPSTKAVTATVSWTKPFSTVIDSTIYVTRYLENVSFKETTVADFNSGTKTGTTVTDTSGGEVTLAAGGKGDWCKPNDFIVGETDLPKQGVADAIYAIEGKAFVGTGENASGVSFANIAISDTDPPTANVAGTFDGYKTNGVFGERDYAYLATESERREVVIIDLNRQDREGKYQEAGYYNVKGDKENTQVYVSGNVGYMITGDKLYNFDLTEKTGSRPSIDPDGVKLEDKGTRVVVVGNYAYVTIIDSRVEVQIIDVSNPQNLRIVGEADIRGSGDAKDIAVNATGTRAYVVTKKSDSRPEFFILNTEEKTGNRPTIGSYEANGMDPKAVTVVPGNRAIIVGKDAEEYQVIDISNESNLVRCGGLDLNVKINGIASVVEADGDAYSYIMTSDKENEFKIIEGGPGGKFAASGTFESKTFDPGYQVAFNRFTVNVNKPKQTDIKFQLASADAVSGSCDGASFTFVGPDKTSATYFTGEAAIPLDDNGVGYENPGRCFRYKVYLSTEDFSQTPTFYDIVVNYSP